MMTLKEYLQSPIPDNNEIWLNGLDIIKHCLKKDTKQTFFKDDRPATRHFDEWQEAMQKRAKNDDDNFQDIYDNAYQPESQWQNFDNDSGMLEVSSFIAGDELCFEDDIQVYEQGTCLSVIIDMAIPYCERNDSYMVKRHQKVYDLIAQCDSENRPIQVIGCLPINIPELSKTLVIFITVKEYNDTIFPAIWGTLTDNQCCNSFINVIMDYFIGTSSRGNGNPTTLKNAEKYFPELEELHIFGTRVKSEFNQAK